ncbi:MAG: serine dehydratase beta chain, partial [Janthinobacterium sp.]
MAVSVFDLFKIGIGPSSSHTVGPMRAAHAFVQRLQRQQLLSQVARVRCQLFGSLGATGRGHASDRAVILGLAGFAPDTVDINAVDGIIAQVHGQQQLLLDGTQGIAFDPQNDLLLTGEISLPFHPNGMRLEAWNAEDRL